jgi:hypothetical protein
MRPTHFPASIQTVHAGREPSKIADRRGRPRKEGPPADITGRRARFGDPDNAAGNANVVEHGDGW